MEALQNLLNNLSMNDLASIVRGESQKTSGVCMSTLSIVQ